MDDIGTVEAEVREFIAGLGELSPRDRVTAAQAIALAKDIDTQTDQPASARGTLDRRLTANLDRLRERAIPAQPAGQPVEDEVDRARRAREERRLAASAPS